MNNKGVTLVELLIVIVVLGIISAFAIPAVDTIINNAQDSSVHNDALMVENAARLYCQDNFNTCGDSASYDWDDFGVYVDGIDIDDTAPDATNSDYATITAVRVDETSSWTVTMTLGTNGQIYYGIPSSANGSAGVGVNP